MELQRLNEKKEKAKRRPADKPVMQDPFSSPVDLPGSVPVAGERAPQAKPPPAPHGRSAGSLSTGPKAGKEELIASGRGHPGEAVSAWHTTEAEAELWSEQRRQQEDIGALRKELAALRQQPPPQAQQKPTSEGGCTIQ